jgi:hypothetical protein
LKKKIITFSSIIFILFFILWINGCLMEYTDNEGTHHTSCLSARAAYTKDLRWDLEERTGKDLTGWKIDELKRLEHELNTLEAEKKEAAQTVQAQEIEAVEISEGTPQSDLESPLKEQPSGEMLCKDILGTWIGEIQYESVTGTYSADGQEVDVNELPLVTKKIGEIKKFELKIITGNDGCVANLDGFSGNVLYRDGQLEITFIEEPTKGNYTGQLVQDNKFEGKAETTNWFGDPIGVMFYSNWWAIKVE